MWKSKNEYLLTIFSLKTSYASWQNQGCTSPAGHIGLTWALREDLAHQDKEFCYGVSRVPQRYLSFSLISAVNFYYVINKLIILIHVPH
jgi:hypothetical protein